jgi:hypothetical protein
VSGEANTLGVVQHCPLGKWIAPVASVDGPACTAAMLDGTRVGPVKLGWQRADEPGIHVSSALCPPTLQIEKIDVALPADLPEGLGFSFALGDDLYDVELVFTVGCKDAVSELNDLRCEPI